MLSADVVTLHCESKERHLRLVRMTSKPHGRHLHVGMQGIGTTRAKHRNDLFKASERTERAQKERLFLRPDGSKRPEVERRPPHPTAPLLIRRGKDYSKR